MRHDSPLTLSALISPTLRTLVAADGSLSLGELKERTAELLKVEKRDFDQRARRELGFRLPWVLFCLREAGFVANPARGRWLATAKGGEPEFADPPTLLSHLRRLSSPTQPSPTQPSAAQARAGTGEASDIPILSSVNCDLLQIAARTRDELRAVSEETRLRVERLADSLEKGIVDIVVCAPVSAGKSTLINALVGYRVMPARNTAMTVLPATVVVDYAVDRPLLSLNKEADGFVGAAADLVTRERKSPAALRIVMQNDPSLEGTLRRSDVPPSIDEPQKFLSYANDIVRLAFLLGWQCPAVRWGDLRFDVLVPPMERGVAEELRPRFVDTPGLTELKLAPLRTMTLQALSAGHAAIVVADFSQLQDFASRERAKPLTEQLKGHAAGSVFVVVNKTDERTSEDDLDANQVSRFSTGLGEHLGAAVVRPDYFETCSIFGSASTSLLRRLGTMNTPLDLADRGAREVLSLLHPADWREDLDQLALDPARNASLETHAARLLRASKVVPLRTAIQGAVRDSGKSWIAGQLLAIARTEAKARPANELNGLIAELEQMALCPKQRERERR